MYGAGEGNRTSPSLGSLDSYPDELRPQDVHIVSYYVSIHSSKASRHEFYTQVVAVLY